MSINNYMALARPNHWFKNIFMLPGVAIALLITRKPLSDIWANLIVGTVGVCFIVSANYVLNEWLDAESDKHHPIKKNRPSVLGKVRREIVYLEYVAAAAAGLGLSLFVSVPYFVTSLTLLIMGMIYNIPPVRSKDKPYLDVLSESVNNPIRLVLGWFMVTTTPFPPSSLLVAYWMAGAFLMAVKRFAEYRFIGDREQARLYRRSFGYYTEDTLIISILSYSMLFAFFFGVFMVKYRIELLLSLPLFMILFSWYFQLGMLPDSPAQRPERLYKEKKFMAYVVLLVVVVGLLTVFDVHGLDIMLEKAFIVER